jgi:SAM-dependent methyltransferase
MGSMHRIMEPFLRLWQCTVRRRVDGEPQMIARGWDNYARAWEPSKLPVLPGHAVAHLGDEWAAEDSAAGGTTYGLDEDAVPRFSTLLKEQVLDPYLPPHASEGLEIGPGGGRLTALLLPRTEILHAADPSGAMLKRLKARFAGVDSLRTYQTDGMTLPPLRPSSLDYVVSFDVFVHFEPRLIYWYLRQIKSLLKPGGVGLLHYASVLSPIGWRQFEAFLERNVRQRTSFQAFGVMCPQLMEKFLKVLDLQVISSDVGFIPRDAIAVFKQPT